MPSIISPTGRALQAELQNMPPDQVQAYLNQNVGKVPMAELLAMKMQLDRMRQAMPQQQTPQSTVAQDMQAQLQQARGISALPVQNVGQPQNYAGGGIVAFQNQGLVDSTMYVDPRGGISSTLPPRNLPATIGRGMSAAEDQAAFWRKVSDFMKAGASQSEAISAANKVARIGAGISAIVGPAMDLAEAGRDKDYTKKWYAERGLDPNKMTEEEQIRAGEAMGSEIGLKNLFLGIPGLFRPVVKKVEEFGEQYRDPAKQKAAQDQAALESGRRFTDLILKQNEEMKRAPTPERREQPGLPSALPKPVAPEAPVAATQPEKTIQDYIAEQQAIRERLGVGKAITEREKVLAARQAASEKDLADRARMSRAQAFFKMAEESAKPGGTLLKGATAGLSQYAEAKQALADRRQALQERAEDLRFTIDQAKEQQALGNYEAARKLMDKAEADKKELDKEARENAQRMKELEFQATSRRDELRQQGEQRAKELAIAKTARETLERQLAAESDPAKRAIILTRLKELAMLSPTYLAAEERYKSNPFGGFGMNEAGWSVQERK